MPIILIKTTICRLLEKPLIQDGFNILNRGMTIPFPMHYHADTFETMVRKILSD